MNNTLRPNIGTKELAFSMKILKSNIINIHWTYKDKQDNTPFEVPADLYPNLNMSDFSTDKKLSDYINIDKSADGTSPFNIDYLITQNGTYAYQIRHLSF